ncbi:iron-containing redox enzyme family protein [Plantactinospora sonchi]|uniref:Iron-containing redox enzyme family protein n=1 Tax=Plantactinospora sonchi TaxID=1544735 RepID=A0ABU7RLQ4_9ACTN
MRPVDRRSAATAAPLPEPRGPLSELVIEALRRTPGASPSPLAAVGDAGYPPWTAGTGTDPLRDEDLQLLLFVCYELHYQGWHGVDDRWEWEPSLIAVRSAAEAGFERALRHLVGAPPRLTPDGLPGALAALVAAADDGPPLSVELARRADLARFREFVVHRSIYHLKEADPHTWGIPRLTGRAKAALVEIQMDEYGGGRADRMHATLFRGTMRWLGLDDRYGRYLDAVPAQTLAINNLISLFGLHRRWRGALLGHLAAFEMTSSLPNRRYGDGLRRLGGDPEATRFYDEHVEADAVHEQIAAHDLCGAFAAEHPWAVPEIWFGAACCLALDRIFAEHLLTCWAGGRSALRAGALAVR